MKKLLLIALLSLTVVACTPQEPEETTAETGMPAQEAGDVAETEVITDAPTTYTMAEVAQHANPPDDCWIVIDGKVYDVSGFAEAGHGGGDTVYEGCGIDATDYYYDRSEFSGNDSPDPHSETAMGFLPNFYIGDVAAEDTEESMTDEMTDDSDVEDEMTDETE